MVSGRTRGFLLMIDAGFQMCFRLRGRSGEFAKLVVFIELGS